MARKKIDAKARSTKAIAEKRFARNRSVRSQQFSHDVMVADVKRKATAVNAGYASAAKRTTVGHIGKGSEYVSVKTSGIRTPSVGQRHRSTLAAAKSSKRRMDVHFLPEPHQSRRKSGVASDRAKLGGRVRSRRAGFLKSKGGSTGRRRVFKRDLRGRFS